ncbi:MAG TPA: Hpt domain-containing protein [Paracoccaceae bacterium]|nr:Hpt domain-containing protein [Paracoccaceae bacterium]HMO72589.1 Hpt domain-containing protein [Paracoccaceae bacterium]
MIDWGRVAELRSEIGDDDIADVVALFLEEADEVVARLAVPMRDGAEVARALHALRGAALNLGLAELATLCGAAEADPAGPALQAVPDCYAASRRALEQGLTAPRAA